MAKKSCIYIGTSGWHYKHWKGTFYPADIKEKDQLATFIQTFNTVEINNSFYRLPARKTFVQWRKSVPEYFIFSVKASRYITHMKKLKETSEALDVFLKQATGLKEKLGPILFQLPPGWKVNTARLEDFIKQLPKHFRFTFEFRNESWYTEEVYALLRTYNCAFCIYELDRHMSPLEVTADFVYIRLHGPEGKYQGSYSKKQLNNWAKRCTAWQKDHKDVFIYFDNDQAGYAAFNADTLQQMLS